MNEKIILRKNGMAAFFLTLILYVFNFLLYLFFTDIAVLSGMVICGIYICIGWIPFMGLRIVRPKEALVLTLFGKYYGTLKNEGFYFVNPFCMSFNPAAKTKLGQSADVEHFSAKEKKNSLTPRTVISLKVMTLNNGRQKINDKLGNPIEIGIAVTWRVVDTAKAVFNVDNYKEFLSLQCDASLREIVRLYPYDTALDVNEDGSVNESLRGSSSEIAEKIKEKIQSNVLEAGLEILEARINYLAYAPEIAAAMLQRQQALAVIDARKIIVEGAVGMVKMALTQLGEQKIVELDDERKASMVSNLLVVLCGNKDSQPVINSGSIY